MKTKKIIEHVIEYQKNKKESYPNFKLIQNLRNKTRNAFKSQSDGKK